MDKKIVLLILAVLAVLPAIVLASHTVSIPNTSIDEDTSGTVNVSAAVSGLGANETINRVFLGSVPKNVSVSFGGAPDFIATITPAANFFGSETLNFTVEVKNTSSGAVHTVSNTFNVVVNPQSDAPAVGIGSEVRVRAGVPFSLQANVTDPDMPQDSHVFSFDSAGWSAFAMSNSGLISFTASDADVGVHQVTIKVTDSYALSASKTVNFLVTESTDDGSLVYTDVELKDRTGKDDETLPGDIMQVNFDLENKLTVEVEGIDVEAWLEDSSGKKVIDKLEVESFDLADRDSESVSVDLQVPYDAKAGVHYAVVLAEGKDENGTIRSARLMKAFTVERKSHDLAVEEVTVSPDPALCGNSADIMVRLWNIGTNDEKVKLTVSNSDLGIDTSAEFELQDRGDDAETVRTFSVNIPSVAPKDYTLDIKLTYNGGKTTESAFGTVTVACGTFVPSEDKDGAGAGTGTLSLDKDNVKGTQGQQIKLTATVRNTGSAAATYTLDLSGLQDWATGFVEPDSITVAGGSSAEAFVYMTPKSSATGTQSASLSVKSGGATLETKKITVELPEKPKLSITPLAGGDEATLPLVLILVAILVTIVLLLVGKKRASGDVEVYGKKRK